MVLVSLDHFGNPKHSNDVRTFFAGSPALLDNPSSQRALFAFVAAFCCLWSGEVLRHGNCASAGVAGGGADADPRGCCSLSSSINSAFQRISASVRRRLAAGCRLPYSICMPCCVTGMSQTISLRLSKESCFSKIQCQRSSSSRAVAAN